MITLITGGSGFIGKRLAGVVDGEIRMLAREKNPGYKTIICDLEKDNIPIEAFTDVDCVYHLAGLAHDFRDTHKTENIYYKVNVEATVQLARLAAKSGIKRFVFVSSVKAGGNAVKGRCANENDQGDPEGVYGKTKLEAELQLLKINQESDMHISIIRPSLVYGPNVKGNLSLMLNWVKKGWFPPLPETGNKRSMIHVDDLVRAILLVANDMRADGEIFIATDGKFYSSREIYSIMCSVLGKTTPKWSVPKFLFDIMSLTAPRIQYKVGKLLGDECYSSTKIEKLGFKARKSLRDMNETDF